MCGILGFVGRPDSARAVNLPAALSALRHRGPDDSDTFRDTSLDGSVGCAFAHTRLAVIDLSPGGHQPMTTPDGRHTLIYNGEVYSFAEIRAELEKEGIPFVSKSDTEVILKAYARWGARAVERFTGMFALAIWDRLDGTLFLARDRLGIKPLYLARRPDGIAFASEVRALLATGLAERRLSPAALRTYLQFGSASEPLTLVAGVETLLPGTVATFRAGKLSTETYWRMPVAANRNISFEDAVAELRPLLSAVVKERLVSDVPLGVFLSGGIDSSSITSIAAHALGHPLRTFTVTFDEKTHSEEAYAEEIATRFKCEHTRVHLSAATAASQFEDALDAMDQPSADGPNTYFVAKAARQASLTVALSGLGGDEVFAGYSHFRRFAPALAFGGVAGRLTPGAILRDLHRSSSNRIRRLAEILKARGEVGATYDALRCMFPEPWVEALVPGRRDPARSSISEHQDPDSVNLVSRLELTGYLRNTLLRDADAMSMASSIEVRVPLIDYRIVELALSFPGRLKLSRERNKPLLQAAVADLAGSPQPRSKMGFVLPLDAWFRRDLAALVSTTILGEGSGVYDTPTARRILEGFQRSEREFSQSRILCLMALARWCKRHRMELSEAGANAPKRVNGSHGKRVLVSTLPPRESGVGAMSGFVVDCLKQRGLKPVLAFYQPYSRDPQLSVPSFVLNRRVGMRTMTNGDALESYALGAFLPELEFNHYRPTELWRRLIDSCDFHVAVSGNPLAAQPFMSNAQPYLLWAATPWREDRLQREMEFALPRKILDSTLVRPVTERLERRILTGGTVLALSEYTRKRFEALAGSVVSGILPMPIDTDLFAPRPESIVPLRVGFTGRLSDPRKNIELFLHTLEVLRKSGVDATGFLVGGPLSPGCQNLLDTSGLSNAVTVHPTVAPDELATLLPTIDVFFVPSHQEGLCIAALEAMACGIPVVSTRCGGPEEFVVPGESGILVEFSPEEAAAALASILSSPEKRRALSRGARGIIQNRYSRPGAAATFHEFFERTFASPQ